MIDNFNVAWCPFCNQGWVEIVKDSSNNKLLLLCGECDTTWENITDIKSGSPMNYRFTGNLQIPSINEIKQIGWDKLLIR